MTEFSNEEKLHHYMGIEMNMQTWNLLGEKDRTEQDDTRMLNFAKASLYHWKKSPRFEPVNGQRGQWMISHVYAILVRGKKLWNQRRKPYAYEAMAWAHSASGNKDECNRWFNKAKEAGELIDSVEDKKIFEGDLKAEPWPGCSS